METKDRIIALLKETKRFGIDDLIEAMEAKGKKAPNKIPE